MDKFVIRGGIPLRGSVSVSGAKNAALPLMAAAIAADGPVRLHGVPQLADVHVLADVLRSLGVAVEWQPDGVVQLEALDGACCVAPYDIVRKMRASVCVLGPLLARRRRACVSLPGGCNIGHRPIDLHLKGLAALGADIRVERGYVIATADRLRGAVVDLAGPYGTTVTGTCNVMLAAVFAEGKTIITSAAREPEVVDLGRLLCAMGGRITGLGTATIRIHGIESLHGAEHTIIPDRIEAATLMMAALATRGEIELVDVQVEHLATVIQILRALGAVVQVFAQTNGRSLLHVAADKFSALNVTARPYPGCPTDVQAQLTSLLTQAPGVSVVTDEVFPSRFMHVSELCRLGADVRRDGASAIVTGGRPLQGASVMASDLRASAGLVIAALAAQGTSEIRRIYHLDRGYERLEDKLVSLGADVLRICDAGEASGSAEWDQFERNDRTGHRDYPARAA